jgi:SWI/SNF-related matrix-associated actin-dependent regulator 1 of chromatin subfamily A
MTVTIKGAGDRVEIAFNYDPQVVEAVREIPGRRWDPARKVWTAPISSARHLAAFVTRTGAVEDADLIAQIRAAAGDQDAAVVASRATDADIDLPEPEGLSYMPFQRAGIAFALKHRNVLIADEMGLGKTIQAIGTVNADTSIRTVVVIVPASLKINWAREIAKWSTRPTEVVIGNGTVYQWDQMFPVHDSVEWLVVNYDVIERWRPVIDSIDLDCLVLDEVHYVKTPKAQRTIAVLGRWNKIEDKRVRPIAARRRIALTGTPILNRPVELWGLAHSLAPETFSSWRGYVYRYCAAQDTRWGLDVSGASNLDELQDRLRSTIMVRRLKADVLTELPAKRRAVVELPAGTAAPVIDAETKAYELSQTRLASLRAAVAAAEASEDREGYREAVEALQKGQAVEFASISEQRHQVALAKIPAVIAHLSDQLEQGKVICFAHHLDVVAAIHDAFPGSVVITGQTSMDNRQAAVDAFQNDPNCRLIIGNIRAMGVGLTLTASSHVVFAELDWTPANLSQAEDRAHRIGQRDSVLVQHLVLEGSLDASMARMLIQKQEVIDAALDTGTAPVIETTPIAETPVVHHVTTLDVSTLNGGYAVPNSEGNLTFLLFDSVEDGKWGGWTFVRQQIGGQAQKLGRQRPGGTYEGPWESLVAAVLADPKTAMETYGKELGICGACMSPLTNAESRARGVGPICAARRGW